MKKMSFLTMLFPILGLGFAQPSWAWHGWGGPRVGIYLGGPYYAPYYDPYYDGYGPYPYAANPAVATIPDNPPPASSNENDLPSTAQISGQRAQLDFDYADGDITKAQYDAGIARLQRAAQPPAPVAAYESAERTTPSSSVQGFTRVSDLYLQLTTLLDQKLNDRDITRAQHDSEIHYLNQIKSQARDDANANNGRLTSAQENVYVRQLHQAYYAISHNLINQ